MIFGLSIKGSSQGFVRTLGRLAQMADAGLEIIYFVGNHDLWMRDYFSKELGIPVFHQPQEYLFNGKRFLIGHGDGLGPGDKGYKRMKKVFVHPLSKLFFRWLHPDLGVRLGQHLSLRNRLLSENTISNSKELKKNGLCNIVREN